MSATLVQSLSRLSAWPRKFPFARNVAVLSGGASLGHCFTLGIAPFLTRLYAPNDMGRWALFTAFFNAAAIAASLQYEVALVLAHSEEEAAHLATTSMLMAVPISFLGGVLLYVLEHFSIFGFGILPSYAAALMVPAVLCVGLFQILRYWSLRMDRFGLVSQATILQNGGRSVSQLVFGAFGAHSAGLLAGEVLGRCIGMGRMMRYTWPTLRIHPLTYRGAVEVLRKHRRFPCFFLPSSLLNQVGTNLPFVLVVSLYGATVGGYYSLVWRCLALPAVLVGISIADAFHARAATLAREDRGRVLQLFHRTTAALLAIGIVPAFTIFMFGEPLFQFVFGSQWRMSGTIAAMVAPWFFASFVVSPLTRIVFVLQGQRSKLVFDTLTLVGSIGVFTLAHMLDWPVLRTISTLSIINTASIVLYFLVLLRITTMSSATLPDERLAPA